MENIIYFHNLQRKYQLPDGIKEKIAYAFESVLDNEKLYDDFEVSVTFVNDKRIKVINNEFRGIDKSTDVLSFPMGENGEYDKNPETNKYILGDVIISLEHAIKQAEEFGHSIHREVVYLAVHSFLHLLGYDHVNDENEAKIMRQKEELTMKHIGLER